MGLQIRHDESAQTAVRRIATEQLQLSIDDLRARSPNTHQAVHEFRKRCKTLRGLLRLVKSQLGSTFAVENLRFRDLSRQLSYVRDAQALIEAMNRLRHHGATTVGTLASVSDGAASCDDLQSPPTDSYALIWDMLIEARDRVAGGEVALVEKMDMMARELEHALTCVESWRIDRPGFDAFSTGLVRNYRQARRGMAAAMKTPTAYHFHEWRKRVKYHWHHTLVLQSICPPLMDAHRKLAESLGERLGEYHDYSVLRAELEKVERDGEFQRQRTALNTLIDQRQLELRGQLLKLGAYMQAERAKSLGKRWQAYWKTWKENGPDE